MARADLSHRLRPRLHRYCSNRTHPKPRRCSDQTRLKPRRCSDQTRLKLRRCSDWTLPKPRRCYSDWARLKPRRCSAQTHPTPRRCYSDWMSPKRRRYRSDPSRCRNCSRRRSRLRSSAKTVSVLGVGASRRVPRFSWRLDAILARTISTRPGPRLNAPSTSVSPVRMPLALLRDDVRPGCRKTLRSSA